MKKEKNNNFILSFSKEEIANSNIRAIIRELLDIKFNMQRHKEFITISSAEFEIISKLGEFVDKSKYDYQIQFAGEVGKIKGKRIVVQ